MFPTFHIQSHTLCRVPEWTVGDVEEWLRNGNKGFREETIQSFVREEINGRALLEIRGKDNDLKELIPKLGERLKFESHLEDLQSLMSGVGGKLNSSSSFLS